MPVPQILGMVGGAALEATMGAINDNRQYDQQERLNSQNRRHQNALTDYNTKKQLEMWEKTGYVPTVDQMKRAGLNPAMLYKGTGEGGSTGISAGSGAPPPAPNTAMSASAATGMGMQLALMKAQKENIEADTAQKQADAQKTAGVDTKLTETQTNLAEGQLAKIAQETQSEEVKTAILKIDEIMKGVEAEIQGKSMNLTMAKIMYSTEEAFEILEQQKVQTRIGKATEQAVIRRIKAEAIGAGIQNILMNEQINLSKEQQLLIKRNVSNMIQQNEREWQNMSTEQKKAEIMKVFADIQELKSWDVPLNQLDGLFNRFVPVQGRTIVEGYNPKRY